MGIGARKKNRQPVPDSTRADSAGEFAVQLVFTDKEDGAA
jgi:hypothetical protein